MLCEGYDGPEGFDQLSYVTSVMFDYQNFKIINPAGGM